VSCFIVCLLRGGPTIPTVFHARVRTGRREHLRSSDTPVCADAIVDGDTHARPPPRPKGAHHAVSAWADTHSPALAINGRFMAIPARQQCDTSRPISMTLR
jgi:hypothetical protein